MKDKLIIAFFFVILYSCDKFEYNHYQVSPKDEYKNINKKNIQRFINTTTDTVKIIVLGDSQRFYSATNEVITKANKIENVDFVIHTGDLVDFGLQREYTLMHELLLKMNHPYVTVIGNHDLIGNGGDIYNAMYGEFNFSFIYNRYKFIFLNSNGREFGFAANVPDLIWLENELSDTLNYEQAIIVNHVPPDNVDFNSELEYDYANTLSRYKQVILSINGHNHNYTYSEMYNDGVMYLNSFSTSKDKFVIIKLWDNDFSVQVVD